MNSIRMVRKDRGVTQEQLAEFLGIDAAQVSRMERGAASMTLDRLLAIAKFLEVDPAQLVSPHADYVSRQKKAGYDLVEGQPVGRTSTVDASRTGRTHGSPGLSALRVYEATPTRFTFGESAVEGFAIHPDKTLHSLAQPPALEGRDDVYAFYVPGNGMEPVYRAGDLVVLEGRRPARIGDDVVVHSIHEVSAMMGRLARRMGSQIELEQFNPAQTVLIETSEISRTERVITVADLLA